MRSYRGVLIEALIVHPDCFLKDYNAELSRPLAEIEGTGGLGHAAESDRDIHEVFLKLLADKSSAQVSRLVKRLRLHGLLKKIGRRYKYYLTRFGKQVITTGTKLRELVAIPQLAFGKIA